MKHALMLIPESHSSTQSSFGIEHFFYWYALWNGLESAGASVVAIPLLVDPDNHLVDTAILASIPTALQHQSFDAIFAPATPSVEGLISTLSCTHRIAVTDALRAQPISVTSDVFSHHLDLNGRAEISSAYHLFTHPCIPDELISLRRVHVGDFSASISTGAESSGHDHSFGIRLAHICSHLAEQAVDLSLDALQMLARDLRTTRLDWIKHRMFDSSPTCVAGSSVSSFAVRFIALLQGHPVVDPADAILSAEQATSIWLRARNEALFKHTSTIRGWDIIRWLDDGAIQHKEYSNQYIPNPDESLFYGSFFDKGCELNTDEQSRLGEIQKCYAILINRVRSTVKTLDVGCGRGWLTEFASHFGEATGIEPIPEVINHARTLFPNNRYLVSTPELALRMGQAGTYDVCLCSEVIEHVPNQHKRDFMRQLRALLKPQGYVVLTTPRGERYDEWMSKYGGNSQPVEDWISEDDMHTLAEQCGFVALYRGRAGYISDIYQVWLFGLAG